MTAYIIRRLLLIIPTLFGIILINFLVIQAAPGGPIEQLISRYTGTGVEATARISSSNQTETLGNRQSANDGGLSSKYRGAQGLDPAFLRELEVMYGFDKPAHKRFLKMLGNYIRFDFGESFFRNQRVIDLVLDKMPVSISLGLWTTLLIYTISIPLGILKAVRDGSRFDFWSSSVVVIGNAIPSFLFAILLIVIFSGGRYFDWFPLRGLTSPGWNELNYLERVADYFWHLALPILSMVIGGFAALTLLTKNSFLEEINKQYVVTARAKGLTERRVLLGHVFRNAMLIVIAGFPSAFVGILFTGALLTEIIFSLDGLGLLGFEAVVNRDYPVMFASLYFFTLLGLVMQLIGDLTYTIIDPRIDFDSREV
ncbi:MAG: microcin C ABC transporter permease YejB [Alphaproteobacteria bacterium]|nr:MAG: Inner membrane ABC transporter permease protein YejB [Alphaproteobacteria bacterium MarineAlpha9_Bin6]PPR40247.1 MAG: Inner membrane ABC transporter permease protein YejB [Alphaproteobacteria bacterium MarineAlpha9_Bin5]HHZ66578.1 microcin C ABC transporter permease YejB [Alphaproteobacteria bacterium]HIO69440.1 microcin C ABC transporter permease YejB [Nitrospirales bacterium]HIB17718.1 microcin C ABC transporter permease YejB [Alphaproteobacteria bacterium]